jgi:hypothetical protein
MSKELLRVYPSFGSPTIPENNEIMENEYFQR